MRKSALLACLTILAACGSSSSKGLNVAPSFTMSGTAFTPSDGGAISVSNKSCTMQGMGAVSVSALMIGFSSYGGLCDFAKKNGMLCVSKQNSKMGSIRIGKVTSAASGAIAPGSYTTGLVMDATGITAVDVDIDEEDATCQSTSYSAAQGGTVTITQTSPTVKGSVAVTLVDGSGTPVGTVSGNFDVGACDYQVDVCTAMAAGSCTTPTCVP